MSMLEQAAYVGVDWGTSSFRLWVMDKAGWSLAEVTNKNGMSSLKSSEFGSVLEAELKILEVGPSIPVIICGMAGAAQGWQDAGYLDVPVMLSEFAFKASKVKTSKRNVWIIPGAAQRDENTPDVMRGEETLLMAAVSSDHNSGYYCLPGTHSKWAKVKNGKLVRFNTFMTGEVFGLLRHQSILQHTVEQETTSIATDEAFKKGFREALSEPERVLQKLFSIRAKKVLHLKGSSPVDLRDRLSGLLLGLEFSGMKPEVEGPVVLIASGGLLKTYATAFDLAEIEYSTMDSLGLARVGLHKAAQKIF